MNLYCGRRSEEPSSDNGWHVLGQVACVRLASLHGQRDRSLRTAVPNFAHDGHGSSTWLRPGTVHVTLSDGMAGATHGVSSSQHVALNPKPRKPQTLVLHLIEICLGDAICLSAPCLAGPHGNTIERLLSVCRQLSTFYTALRKVGRLRSARRCCTPFR